MWVQFEKKTRGIGTCSNTSTDDNVLGLACVEREKVGIRTQNTQSSIVTIEELVLIIPIRFEAQKQDTVVCSEETANEDNEILAMMDAGNHGITKNITTRIKTRIIKIPNVNGEMSEALVASIDPNRGLEMTQYLSNQMETINR